ncbi:MAG: hypothetical protein ACJ74Z_21595 [Bryobacteraceae bacterium]
MGSQARSVVFRLYPLRFSFIAREPIYFPPGKSSNILRGAFGLIIRRIACVPQCTDAHECEWRASCPYARIFEPSATNLDAHSGPQTQSALRPGPSGLAAWPRPFVFRASHLDRCIVSVGESFHFDLNLFDIHSSAVAYLVLAFAQLAREGLGARRSRVELAGVWRLNAQGDPDGAIFDGKSLSIEQSAPPLELELAPSLDPVSRLRIQFLTPTELKSGQQLAGRPEFSILAARVRDRISTLLHLYGDGPLTITSGLSASAPRWCV